MTADRETPVSGLRERTGETTQLNDGAVSDVTVPCKQCGAMVTMTAAGLDRWRMFNARLSKQGEAPLRRDEILVCDRTECREAEREAIDKYATARDAKRSKRREAARGRKRRAKVDDEIA